MMNFRCQIQWALAILACVALPLPIGADNPSGTPLPDPDGRPADMSKPVQVYILMGQSNMLGFGKINGGNGSLTNAIEAKSKYPYLKDDAGEWTERKDVRNVRVMSSGTGSMKVHLNEWMTIKGGNIGPEIGIGHYVGHATDAPVLILKTCIGNRSLGWDLLPPGSEQFEEGGMTYAGYKDSPDKWKTGEEPKRIGWYAGMQYDGDTANAKTVLKDLSKYYPGAKRYEVAGFFWWQGDKDRYNPVHASHYEKNLVQLIKTLRKDFKAPNAKFVCATLGQTSKGAGGAEGQILEAQFAVSDSSKHPEFKGSVATVYSKPLCHGGSSNGHYGGNAETYMDIGEAMGQAMVELLGSGSALSDLVEHLDSKSKPVYKALENKKYVSAWKGFRKLVDAYKADVKAKKLSKKARARQRDLLKAFQREINWPVDQALAEIESLKASGDVYQLSLAFRKHDKTFGGIDRFDEAADPTSKELRSSKMRSAISAGKKFYALIDKLKALDAKRSASKRKGPRSEADTKAITAYLNRFAKSEKDNIYGKAAAIVAEKITNPEHAIGSVGSYLRLAQAK